MIQRLNEGKVYVPQTAKRAVQNFFTPRNLTALRELALRRTADRVDDQMTDYLRQSAIEGPWNTSDHLLVCFDCDGQAERVVGAGGRFATRLNASWIAAHVETSGDDDDAEKAKMVDDAFRLAERLGAETVRLPQSDPVEETLRYARRV